MASKSDQSQFLYLTTTGRVSGIPREIEIWFVEREGRLYVLSEKSRQAQWVRNLERNSEVRIRLADSEFAAVARVLDASGDKALYRAVRELSLKKYGWGDGLPVELTPVNAR